MKITHDQKETALEILRARGTMKKAAEIVGVDVKTLNNEMNRSAVFKKRVHEAREEGVSTLGDRAVAGIEELAFPVDITTVRDIRAVLTARIALANAFVPGFRGSTTIQGKVEHIFPQVKTAIPRPNYDPVITLEVPKQLTTPKKRGRKKKVVD